MLRLKRKADYEDGKPTCRQGQMESSDCEVFSAWNMEAVEKEHAQHVHVLFPFPLIRSSRRGRCPAQLHIKQRDGEDGLWQKLAISKIPITLLQRCEILTLCFLLLNCFAALHGLTSIVPTHSLVFPFCSFFVPEISGNSCNSTFRIDRH